MIDCNFKDIYYCSWQYSDNVSIYHCRDLRIEKDRIGLTCGEFAHNPVFTEKKSVRNWWTHAYGFYQSESVKFIPDQFLFNQNPIPPSNQ